ncbi:MAG TPA: TadE/TadG family type IV pilus assembly protein [Acidobacteriaceae bacterium]|jgi:Flp pilus assembly protein TadG
MTRAQLFGLATVDQGSSLVEVAVVLPMLLLILIGVVDLGRYFYLANEVAGAAHSGAMYGSQHASDTTNMVNAAKLDAPNVSGLTVNATWGCECPDGTNASASCTATPSCSTNVIYYATVKASATYTALFPWQGLPSPLTLSSSATMRSNTQ